jgi:regulator of protease activity HflC (stomatin/prohibitin superfamily)
MIKERLIRAVPGLLAIVLIVIADGLAIWLLVRSIPEERTLGILAAVALFLGAGIAMPGIFVVYPNEAKVLTLFGRYMGSVKEPGIWFANPFAIKKKVSLRVRNFETTKLKVNDNHSNPIEIGAVVVWQVIDSAEALFEVDDFEHFVKVQSESALRGLATAYPYDAHQTDQESLSGHPVEVAKTLQSHVQDRLAKAGVQVIEARISHLAYAPEIAQAMLQRQQASAIIAARQKIVEGAVGMVENALDLLSKREIVHLDDERRATMVSNLLVVLCSERSTQPVVNAGTLYA